MVIIVFSGIASIHHFYPLTSQFLLCFAFSCHACSIGILLFITHNVHFVQHVRLSDQTALVREVG